MTDRFPLALNAEPEITLGTINKVLREFKLLSTYATWFPATQKWMTGELAGLAALMNAAGLEVGEQGNVPDVLDIVNESESRLRFP